VVVGATYVVARPEGKHVPHVDDRTQIETQHYDKVLWLSPSNKVLDALLHRITAATLTRINQLIYSQRVLI
jgi:hypothetical protein